MASASAGVMIANSGLPAASRERLGSRIWNTPEEVQQAIDSERQYLAALSEDNVINLGAISPRTPQISMGLTGFEQLELAVEAMIGGVRPETNVRPLTGIRELYMLLSGDFEMEGLFHQDRVTFANVNSSTMAGIVANALNKRVMNEFIQYPRWWEPIVLAEDFDSLQQLKWVTLGGVGVGDYEVWDGKEDVMTLITTTIKEIHPPGRVGILVGGLIKIFWPGQQQPDISTLIDQAIDDLVRQQLMDYLAGLEGVLNNFNYYENAWYEKCGANPSACTPLDGESVRSEYLNAVDFFTNARPHFQSNGPAGDYRVQLLDLYAQYETMCLSLLG